MTHSNRFALGTHFQMRCHCFAPFFKVESGLIVTWTNEMQWRSSCRSLVEKSEFCALQAGEVIRSSRDRGRICCWACKHLTTQSAGFMDAAFACTSMSAAGAASLHLCEKQNGSCIMVQIPGKTDACSPKLKHAMTQNPWIYWNYGPE